MLDTMGRQHEWLEWSEIGHTIRRAGGWNYDSCIIRIHGLAFFGSIMCGDRYCDEKEQIEPRRLRKIG